MVHRKIRRYSYLKKMKMNKKEYCIILLKKINFYYFRILICFYYKYITNYKLSIKQHWLYVFTYIMSSLFLCSFPLYRPIYFIWNWNQKYCCCYSYNKWISTMEYKHKELISTERSLYSIGENAWTKTEEA